jgi:predicted RNase H-like HicB family nuclease
MNHMSENNVMTSRDRSRIHQVHATGRLEQIVGDEAEAWLSAFDPADMLYTPILNGTYDPVAVEQIHDGVVSGDIEGLPRALVDAYVDIAVGHAQVVEADPGVWVATVAGLDGAYGDGDSMNAAIADLREAIVGWVAVKRRIGATDIPPMEGIDLNPRS